MKWRRLTFTCLLATILIACTDKEDTAQKEPQPPSNQTEATEEPNPTLTPTNPSTTFTDRLTDDQKLTLGTLLSHTADVFGISSDIPEFNDHAYGIAYAEYLDFNNDERGDILTIFASNEFIEDVEQRYLQNTHILEVWTVDEDNQEENLLFMPLQRGEELYASYTISLIKLNAGGYAIKEYVTFTDASDEERTTFTAIQDGEVTSISLFHEIAKGVYYADGHTIDEEVYTEAIADYEGEEHVLIDSEDGESYFTKQPKTPANMTSDIIYALNESAHSAFKALEQVDSYTIQAEVEYANRITKADIYEPSNHFDMFSYLMLYEAVEPDLPEEDGYLVYSAALIEAKYLELFGTELTPESLSLPTLSDDVEDESLFFRGDGLFFYEDRKFYMHPIDFSSPMILRTVEEAYKLSDDTYYIVAAELQFNDYAYMTVYDDYLDTETLLTTNIETWDDRERYYATSGAKKYIIMTLKQGQPVFQYVSDKPLTLSNAESYILN